MLAKKNMLPKLEFGMRRKISVLMITKPNVIGRMRHGKAKGMRLKWGLALFAFALE